MEGGVAPFYPILDWLLPCPINGHLLDKLAILW